MIVVKETVNKLSDVILDEFEALRDDFQNDLQR